MGHAQLTNLSKAFHRQLYARGKVSLAEIGKHCGKHKIYLQASEGEYTDQPMIRMGLMEVLNVLLNYDHEPLNSSVVEPTDLTDEQREVLRQWGTDEFGEWDCGDDGTGGQYGIFDSIKWQFAPGWRKQYPDLPTIGNFTN